MIRDIIGALSIVAAFSVGVWIIYGMGWAW